MSKMLRGSLYLMISTLFFMLSGYAVNVWLGRTLGPAKYGLYGLLVTIMTIVNITQTSGLPQGLAKFIAADKQNSDSILASALKIQLIATFVIAIVFAALAPLIARIFGDKNLIIPLEITALIFPSYGIFSILVGYYNGLQNFFKQAALNILYAIGKIILVIGLSIKFGLSGAMLGFTLAAVIALVVGWHTPRVKKIFSSKVLILYSLPIIGFSVLTALQLSLDILMLKAINGSAVITGYYAASQNLALVLFYVMSSIGSAVLPRISESFTQDAPEISQAIAQKALRYTLFATLPLVSIMIALRTQLILIIYTHQYIAAQAPLAILLMAYSLLILVSLLGSIFNGIGLPRYPLLSSLMGVISVLLAGLILIPKLGAVGASLATTAGAAVALIYSLVIMQRRLKVLPPLKSIARLCAAAAGVYILAVLIHPVPLFAPFVAIILLALYVILAIASGEVSMNDISAFRAFIPGTRNL
jgi:O-antigen/teichoic acid export membrane protein